MASFPSSLSLCCQKLSIPFPLRDTVLENPWKSVNYYTRPGVSSLICSASKKQTGFMGQILDYIEGGPKLRKWYGAPDLLAKDGGLIDEEDEMLEEEETRDAVLVTSGDTEIGQLVILSLILKRAQVKALVKDKRAAVDAFGTYVKSMTGDTSDRSFLMKALRGVRAIICPSNLLLQKQIHLLAHPQAPIISSAVSSEGDIAHKQELVKKYLAELEGFLSDIGSVKGIQHIILLSQLAVYRGSGGIQALMNSKARKLAERDEAAVIASGIPYTIIRAGKLQSGPGSKLGFNFKEGSAAGGRLSKEDAALICVEALDAVPQRGLVFEVVNGEDKVSDWKECFGSLTKNEQLQ